MRYNNPVLPSWRLEEKLLKQGYKAIAGIDEAGRGAFAGPVVVGVVALRKADYAYRDSKTLNFAKREKLAVEIKEIALNWALGIASPREVDKLNVLAATHLAAKRAIKEFAKKLKLDAVVTDYLKLDIDFEVLAVAKADQQSFQVAAASILAKDYRDKYMISIDKLYPQYGFAANKGYGSLEHRLALKRFGPCAIHRLSYKPVAQARLFD